MKRKGSKKKKEEEDVYSDEELNSELEETGAYIRVQYKGEELFLDKKKIGSVVYRMNDMTYEFAEVGKVVSLSPLVIKMY